VISDESNRWVLGASLVTYRSSQFLKHRPQFTLGILVVLGEGESEGLVQPKLGVGAAAETDEGLAEQDAGHHPIRFLVRAELQVRERFCRPGFREQGLREAEAEKLIVRLPGNEVGEVGGA
jgi:hypothetical protein